MRGDFRRLACAGFALATVLHLAACTSAPEEADPAPSPSVSSSSEELVLDEHDGYVAYTRNCARLDWTPIAFLGRVESDPYSGYTILPGKPPEAYCNGRLASNAGAARIKLTLQPSEEYAHTACDAGLPDQREEGEPLWDFVNGSADDESGHATFRLREGVLCVEVELTLASGVVGEMTDPKTELRAIALALAENARETSLRENHPDLPSPSES